MAKMKEQFVKMSKRDVSLQFPGIIAWPPRLDPVLPITFTPYLFEQVIS